MASVCGVVELTASDRLERPIRRCPGAMPGVSGSRAHLSTRRRWDSVGNPQETEYSKLEGSGFARSRSTLHKPLFRGQNYRQQQRKERQEHLERGSSEDDGDINVEFTDLRRAHSHIGVSATAVDCRARESYNLETISGLNVNSEVAEDQLQVHGGSHGVDLDGHRKMLERMRRMKEDEEQEQLRLQAATRARIREPGLAKGEVCKLCSVHGTRRVCGSRGVSSPDLFVTMCEVKMHDSQDDCWIVSRGRVYDVSHYMEDHPGGQRSLLRRGGGIKDCAEDHDFHSRHGQNVWERLCIGRVVPCDTPPGVVEGDGPSCIIL